MKPKESSKEFCKLIDHERITKIIFKVSKKTGWKSWTKLQLLLFLLKNSSRQIPCFTFVPGGKSGLQFIFSRIEEKNQGSEGTRKVHTNTVSCRLTPLHLAAQEGHFLYVEPCTTLGYWYKGILRHLPWYLYKKCLGVAVQAIVANFGLPLWSPTFQMVPSLCDLHHP